MTSTTQEITWVLCFRNWVRDQGYVFHCAMTFIMYIANVMISMSSLIHSLGFSAIYSHNREHILIIITSLVFTFGFLSLSLSLSLSLHYLIIVRILVLLVVII